MATKPAAAVDHRGGGVASGSERARRRDLERLHLTVLPRSQPTAAWMKRQFGADVTWLPFDLHPE